MAEDISGFGASVRILASNTFPTGFDVTQFADDSDPIDAAALEITGKAMGLNGNKVNWTTANPIETTINVITGSEDDVNLSLLFEANRAGLNKASAKDVVTMIISYPNGTTITLTGGSCDEFPPTKSIASEGRFKTNAYVFSFENRFAV